MSYTTFVNAPDNEGLWYWVEAFCLLFTFDTGWWLQWLQVQRPGVPGSEHKSPAWMKTIREWIGMVHYMTEHD